tara:strand:+ start:402 stop:1667 length:1266 start_codon:yes stop_codon:yes gene_type:complete
MSQGFQPNPTIEYLFLDLNSYFASVEQQVDPRLMGKPVAVLPSMTDSTCAIAASYEAKAYGIKTGTKIYEAKRMCPELICVPARHDVYVDYHHRIFDEVERHIHVSKVCSIDEAACLLARQDRTPAAATELANQIKRGIAENVGPAIKCSIGIAPNAFLAKIASDMQKPDGLTILHPGRLKDPLCRLSLTDLTGISKNMERRLNYGGIYTIEDLWNVAPKHARRIWGGVGGERFWYKLHGYNVPDVETQKSVVGHSRMLDPKLRPPEEAHRVLRHLTHKAATRLRRYEFYTRRLGISVKTVDGHKWARDTDFPATQDSFRLLEVIDRLWPMMMRDLKPGLLLKVSVALAGLQPAHLFTPDLFEDYQPDRKVDVKLSTAIDGLNKKHGANTVTIGQVPKTRAGYVGTKIAFNRIPEREEFLE